MEIVTNTIATMKKLLFLFILMLLPMLASAQTVSDVQHRKLKLKKDVFGESNPDITLEQILTS